MYLSKYAGKSVIFCALLLAMSAATFAQEEPEMTTYETQMSPPESASAPPPPEPMRTEPTTQTGRPKAAVYITGATPDRDALRLLVNNFLTQSGDYQMIAVDAVDAIEQEIARQMSGAVSDDEIARIGYGAGAQFICVVEQVVRHDGAIVSVRMVDVESHIAKLSAVSMLREEEDIVTVVECLVGSMLGAPPAAKCAEVVNEPMSLQEMLTMNSVGIKLGLNFPSMAYSDEDLRYSSSIHTQFSFEMFFEYMINHALSVRPGLKFTTRGQRIEESNFDYELTANYTELTVPVSYMFSGYNNIFPYALAGPVLSFASGDGVINYNSYSVDINQNNLQSVSFGLYLGVGAKYPLAIGNTPLFLGFEVGYHLGLTDTYSEAERNSSANAVNAPSYNIDGTRTHRGFEFGITLATPLTVPIHAGRNVYRRLNPPPKKEEAPPVVPEPEPAPAPVVAPEPESRCYTLEEMRELIRLGEDIGGKKICAVRQVNFSTGSYVLTARDKVYLDEIVALMQMNETMRIRVNGHSDNVGSEELNMTLSQGRARAVHDYLRSKGIHQSRLSYEFFGPSRPIADNDTEDGRAINRRVEFEIIE